MERIKLKRNVEQLLELALIGGVARMKSPDMKAGRVKGKFKAIDKLVTRKSAKIYKSDNDIEQIYKILKEFEAYSGWKERKIHVGPLTCFCLAIIDGSRFEFPDKVVSLLNEINDYYERANKLPAPSNWSGALAYDKWCLLLGKDTGPSSDDRLAAIDAEIEREFAMKEYKAVVYG